LKIPGLLALNGAHDHVFSALMPPPSFIEHTMGLAYAGRVAKKYLEFRAPPLALLRLHLLEEPLRTGPWEFRDSHCVNLSGIVYLKEGSRNEPRV
jgi:hypothetical protein